MFEPDMKPIERKLIIVLLVFILGSLAFITYRNLQAHTRHTGLTSPTVGQASTLHLAA